MACIDPDRRGQDRDNWAWIRDAEKNRLVVGTQARILYQDALGRTKIALTFNEMVRTGEVGPIMLGRDHHDCGGTDSPFRETSNIKDGSNVMADMATQMLRRQRRARHEPHRPAQRRRRGHRQVHQRRLRPRPRRLAKVDAVIGMAMPWDVMGGVARRAWARNEHAVETCAEYNGEHPELGRITLPYTWIRRGLVGKRASPERRVPSRGSSAPSRRAYWREAAHRYTIRQSIVRHWRPHAHQARLRPAPRSP